MNFNSFATVTSGNLFIQTCQAGSKLDGSRSVFPHTYMSNDLDKWCAAAAAVAYHQGAEVRHGESYRTG